MILATTQIEDFDRFLGTFSTKGAEKRKQHGSQGARRLPRSQRGRPRLGGLRLGRRGLAELRLRPRGPADHAGGRTQGQAPGGGARRRLRRLGVHGSGSEERNDRSSRAPIKVGVITDQTGPLSFMGIANANVAKMVIDDINAAGGLLGRRLELYLEDSETTDSAAGARRREARRAGSGRRHPRRHLQLDAAGHQGPGGGGGQEALHLPRAVRGAGVRPAHLLHRPGAGAAGRAAHPLADAADRREAVLRCRRPTTSGRTS